MRVQEALPGDLQSADSGRLWRAGEDAEAEFDYEAARNLYREAVRRSDGSDVVSRAEQYAAFLVERYGQFEEVAAWLDDPGFDPTAGATPPDLPPLAAHVAAAAAQIGHPRAGDLDRVLAENFGAPDSLSRVARKRLDAGDPTGARNLLEKHARRLHKSSPAAELLAELRDKTEADANAALADAIAALDRGDLEEAGRELARQAAQLSDVGAFKSLAARLNRARHDADIAQSNASLQAAILADELDDALAIARRLAKMGDGAPDRVADVEAMIDSRAVLGLVAKLAETAPGTAEAFALLAGLAARQEGAQVPEPFDRDWQLACSAHRHGLLEQDAAKKLVLAHSLQAGSGAGDEAGVQKTLEQLGEAWLAVDAVGAAEKWLDKRRKAAASEAENACLESVADALAEGDVQSAQQQLEAYLRDGGTKSPAIRDLHREVAHAQAAVQRRLKLRTQVRSDLDRGRLFAAKRALDRLEEVELDDDVVSAFRNEWQDTAGGALVAAPVAPFGLSVGDGPVAVGVSGERMAIVTDRLWLTVNLQTRGLSPFQLPEAFAIDATPAASIGACADMLRLIGFSAGRVVVIEQTAGGRPTVVEAREVSELLRGETLADIAIEASSETIALLSAGSGGKSGGRFVHVEVDGLEPVASERPKPGLAGICAVRHGAATLATTDATQRFGRSWAMARYEDDGKQAHTWTQDDLAEPIATPKKAIAWPDQDRIFASYTTFDLFEAGKVVQQPSLLVMRGDRPVYASSDLRRRFAPVEKLVIDHSWTFDPVNGRLWYAALPRHDSDSQDALLLGVDASTLRADKPRPIEGAKRILAIEALDDGAAALCKLHDGKLAVARAMATDGSLTIRIDKLPV